MKRATLNSLIDTLAFTTFLLMTSSGLVLEFLLPPRSGHRLRVLGLTRHDWGEVHLTFAYLFLAILSIHLILHWRFILQTFQGGHPASNRVRLAVSVSIFLFLCITAALPFLAGTGP